MIYRIYLLNVDSQNVINPDCSLDGGECVVPVEFDGMEGA